eukprot:4151403-Prymnesium_polylepis.1
MDACLAATDGPFHPQHPVGGEFRPDDLENTVSLMTSSRVLVITIDKFEVCGYEHDISGDDMNAG